LTGAILINPYSAEDIAEGIAKALSMPKAERLARWKPMFETVRDHDVVWWRKRFIDALEAA
jgi:trehalose 6-phosphate synthase